MALVAGFSEAQPAGPPQDPASGVVHFAVEAVAKADLLDPEGTLSDYRRADADGNTWVVTFDTFECVAVKLIEVCRDHPDGDSSIVVEAVGDVMRVVRASGPMSAQQRGLLLAHTPGAGPPAPQIWEFPAAILNSNNRVEGSPVWTGDIGRPGGSACSAELVDAAGTIVWRSMQELYLEAPIREEARAGGIIAFPAIEDSIDGTPRITCETWSGRGWQVAGEPAVAPVARGAIGVFVDLEWNDPAFPRVASRCSAVVFQADGSVGGEATIYVTGAGSLDEDSRIRRGRPIVVEVPDPAAVVDAEVECDLAPIQDLEAQS